MKQFLSFVKKEFYHIVRDKVTMLILLGIPVVQIILFGFAITTEVRNSNIAVLDNSDDVSTRRIIEQLDVSEYFNVVKRINSSDEIDKIFRSGEVSVVLVFDDDFSANLFRTGESSIQIIVDATDPNQATIVSNYAKNIIFYYQQELLREYKIPYQIVPEIKMLYNPQLKSSYNFVPGIMGTLLMLICAMMTSISIVREKEMGTMEILLVSPIKPIKIILAKVVPYFGLSIINVITILLLSVFVLGVPVTGSLFGLLSISLIYILLGLSLGLLISTVVNTQVAAILASGMGLMIPVIILSGMIFPIESMPQILQWISAVVPTRWYIAAVKKLMIQGVDIIFVGKELLILSGMAVMFIFISLKKFSIRLQ